jgi:hypothetical protein
MVVVAPAAEVIAVAKGMILLVRTAGLEPATSCSGGKRSIRLSYARKHA